MIAVGGDCLYPSQQRTEPGVGYLSMYLNHGCGQIVEEHFSS